MRNEQEVGERFGCTAKAGRRFSRPLGHNKYQSGGGIERSAACGSALVREPEMASWPGQTHQTTHCVPIESTNAVCDDLLDD